MFLYPRSTTASKVHKLLEDEWKDCLDSVDFIKIPLITELQACKYVGGIMTMVAWARPSCVVGVACSGGGVWAIESQALAKSRLVNAESFS